MRAKRALDQSKAQAQQRPESASGAGNHGRHCSSSTCFNIVYFLRIIFVRHIRVIMVNTPSPFPPQPHPTIPPRRTKKESLAFPKSHAQCEQGPQR